MPRRRAVGARDSSVSVSTARRWRRRPLLKGAAAAITERTCKSSSRRARQSCCPEEQWRRRHLLREAAAVSPPTLRPAGGGGVWCARQSRLPHFAVWRLDARVKCARGSSTVGCCVWAFGTVGRTRSSSGDSGPHRSACTARLGASGGPNSFAGASPPRRRIVGAAATRLPTRPTLNFGQPFS